MNTIPKLADLTPEQRRILAAEALGYKRMPACNGVVRPDGEWIARTETYDAAILLVAPDPDTNHADAFALVERLRGNAHPSATTDLHRKFRDELAKQCGVAWYRSAEILSQMTPQKMTSAFLLATGLATE